MKIKKKWHKVLSLVLALTLIAGMLPLVGQRASAAGENVIPDPGFRKLINQQLSKDPSQIRPDDGPVTRQDMERLERITIGFYSDEDVQNIEGIQYAINLTSLRILKHITSGVEQIKGLTKLKSVTIKSNVVDLSWFDNSTQLQSLELHACSGFADLSNLNPQPALVRLDLSSAKDLQSLEGLRSDRFPSLEAFICNRANKLSDISALRTKLPKLSEVNFGGNSLITDITPLKGYDQLKDLALEKVEIRDNNRQDYRDMISSLVNLEKLSMPYCGITDQDTEMFRPLQKLQQLVLNANKITDVSFCADLPKSISVLGLAGNDISNMDILGNLTNLKILGLGSNQVTDFQFLSKLPKITAGYVRHAEGSETFPAEEDYSFSKTVTYAQDGVTITVDNPYVGLDGRPIPFDDVIVDGDKTYTVRYDRQRNQIVFENVMATGSAITLWAHAPYKMPLPGGEIKHFELYVAGDIKVMMPYTVSYDWGTGPEGQTLPVDNTVYNTQEAALAAMDQTFTAATSVAGTKDGKVGTWRFSGWKPQIEGKKVKFTGSWTFQADAYTVSYDWGAAPEGQTLPVDNTVYNTEEAALAAMDKTFTAETSVAGTKDGKAGTWRFSGWKAQTEGEQVKFTGSWTFAAQATPPAVKPETPQTGDGIMWIVLLTCASAAAIAVTAYARKKEY